MSTIVRYSSGSTYTLVPNKVDIEKVQDLDGQFHIPYSSIVGMMRLGLGVQKITVSGDILDMSACLWHDVVAISFDSGTSYQTVYFSGVPYTSDCWSGIYPYALSLLASPLREGVPVRYPSSGYKWGNQSITGISQAGNVSAFPTIHYLAPLFYAPLSNTFLDFAGQGVSFLRAAAKVHGGVSYAINAPIFDNGLYLASDTAQDVATWTPPASTVRTVAMQLRQTRPITGTNLVTNGDFETNTTGWVADNGETITRTTVSPLIGTGSMKVVIAGSGGGARWSNSYAGVPATAGHVYYFSALVKTYAAAGRKAYASIWSGGSATGASIDCSASDRTVFMIFAATLTEPSPCISLDGYTAGDYFVADSVFCIDLTTLFHGDYPAYDDWPIVTVWTAPHNKVTINIADNLVKWTDDTTTVQATFPTAAYFAGTLVDVVLIEDTAHAVTIAAHTAYGPWTSATGTLAALTWPQLTLGNLEGSLSNLIEYPYVLTATEYQDLVYSSLSLRYAPYVSGVWQNALYIGNRYAGEIIKGSDKRLLNAAGGDISALLGGSDIAIGSDAVTIVQSQGMAARWYVELKRTDV